MRRQVWLACLLLALPAPLLAQEGGSAVFSTHGLAWQPTISVQDFGWDTNVNNGPTNPISDFSATLKPGVEGALNLAHLKLSGAGLFDLIYYEKTTANRAFNRRFNGRVEAPLKAFVPNMAAALQRVTDRQTVEVDTPQRHTERDLSVGANLLFSSRAAIQVIARRSDSLYDQGSTIRGVSAPTQVNHHDETGTVGARIALTPLTSLIADAQVTRSAYPLNPLKDQQVRSSHLSLEFSPDGVIRGGAGMGWKKLTTTDPAAVPYNGLIFNVDVGYVLLEVTRFDGRYYRDTAVSIEAPYYVETAYGLDVLQTFLGPTELIARFNRSLADYQALVGKGTVPRIDQTDTFGGGVAIRMGKGTRMTINYEYSKRTSILDQLVYDRQRVFTSVSLGL